MSNQFSVIINFFRNEKAINRREMKRDDSLKAIG